MIQYTVIMPVYNAEKYLDKNLLFFKELNRDDVELLIINDGSTDNSLKKIQSYAIKNCVIINQKNYGVSYSRNIGIKKAKGKYITFLDCDDFLSNNIFEILDKYIKKRYDVIRYGFNFFDGVNYESYKLVDKNKVYKDNEIFKLKQEAMSTFKYNAVWNQFINRDLLLKNEIYFNENHKYAEDLEFNINLFSKCKSMCILSVCLYNYYINNFGITKSVKYNDVVKCTKDAIDVYTNNVKIAFSNDFLNNEIILHSINEIANNVKKIFLSHDIENKKKKDFIRKIQKVDDILYLKRIVKQNKTKIAFFNYILIFSKYNTLFFPVYLLWGNRKIKERSI